MKTLEQLENGKQAIIKGIDAGCGLRDKMYCINIRQGKVIKKIVSQPFKGPIIILVDNRQCAIGRGMACRIMVEEI